MRNSFSKIMWKLQENMNGFPLVRCIIHYFRRGIWPKV